MHKLTTKETARLRKEADRWTMVAGEAVKVTYEPFGITVIPHSGDYEIDCFTSSGQVHKDETTDERFLLFLNFYRKERRFYLDAK